MTLPTSFSDKPGAPSVPPESPRDDCGPRFLHRADRDLQAIGLLLRHRARTPEDFAFQHHTTPDGGVGRATTAGSLPRGGAVPLRHLRPGLEVRRRRPRFLAGNGSEAQANEPTVALAEGCGGTVGGQLPARDPGPRIALETRSICVG